MIRSAGGTNGRADQVRHRPGGSIPMMRLGPLEVVAVRYSGRTATGPPPMCTVECVRERLAGTEEANR